ncbi:MAG TPA: trehalose-6-phosphate synthase [Thermoanaerobaculia bacterium]|nr:trehalose-6-phosphate synthase [Thermoanaerobaculia bacterium]
MLDRIVQVPLVSERGDAAPGRDRLRRLADELDAPVVVVANREPYVHETTDAGIVVQRPPSGLVTGIEPLLKECGGTWVAHGSGSADFETCGPDGVVAVPPEDPAYDLRRVFLSQEEVDRYYCGFANEALWPLCHRAWTQPVFRQEDWEAYRSVNRRFARAAADAQGKLVLVQDYHFALVPRFLRERARTSAIGVFWHIPWPDAGTFSICPWNEPILEGLLGADVLGFHTAEYCTNFIESVERMLPRARVDFSDMSVALDGRRVLVRAFPISIEWPYPAAAPAEGAALRAELGIGEDVHVSVGVDRCDYTKGLLERIAAIELLLEEHPELLGRYVHVQVAAPTRMQIGRYQDLNVEVANAAARVNERFGSEAIVLKLESLPPEAVRRYYAMGDSAVVTPLHDGMNLVAKEYVASCSGARGALVLSRFAGAAAELDGALLVNPYDLHDVASAVLRAVRMPAGERASRLRLMRRALERNTASDWAVNQLTALARVRRGRSMSRDAGNDGRERAARYGL